MSPRFVSVLIAVTCAAGALCGVQKWRATELTPQVARETTRRKPTRERPPWRRRASTKTEARSPVTEEAAAKTAEVRSPVTEEAAAKIEVRSPVTDEVAARPFNLADEVLSRKGCHRGGDPVGPRAVAPLAIARAGSDTVILTMKRWERGLSHPFPHDHYCTLEDYAARGARRVVVSLRDPVSRLISGYMRRMEGAAPARRRPGYSADGVAATPRRRPEYSVDGVAATLRRRPGYFVDGVAATLRRRPGHSADSVRWTGRREIPPRRECPDRPFAPRRERATSPRPLHAR